MKKIVFLILAMLLLVSLVACNKSTPEHSSGMQTDPSGTTEETYTVSYQNAGMSNQTVKKGTVIQQPSDPQKKDHIFGGWYVDASFTTPAVFPITVNANTSLYARFYDYQTAFENAREKTIGETVSGYEYDYTTTATVTYSAFSAAGKTEGNAKYSTSGDVSFYDAHTNSGLLFYDGSVYQIRRDNQLQKVSLDENDLLIDYEVEEVDDSYRFDSSSFAKALFEYDASQLKSIEKTAKANEYKLKTSFNVSAGIALASKLLNNATVQKLIGEIPENQVNTGMYVTFANGEVLSYRYEMQISISTVQFTLIYSLNFKNVGVAKAITPRTFSNLSLTPAQIASAKTEIGNYVSAYEAQTASGYDFVVKTGIDFEGKNEINSTFQGSAQRKTTNGIVYFHNDIEIDSDYKNADLYQSGGIADVHIKRTRLANGTVYNIEKKLLKDTVSEITPYTANRTDSYYLFDLFAALENYTFVQKITKNSTVTYSIGIANAEAQKILTYLNEQLDLDPLGKATVDPTVFGAFNTTSVKADKIRLTVEIKDSKLSSITVQASGEFETSLPDSRDFSAKKTADFSVSYTLTANEAGNSFTPYETVKKAQ